VASTGEHPIGARATLEHLADDPQALLARFPRLRLDRGRPAPVVRGLVFRKPVRVEVLCGAPPGRGAATLARMASTIRVALSPASCGLGPAAGEVAASTVPRF